MIVQYSQASSLYQESLSYRRGASSDQTFNSPKGLRSEQGSVAGQQSSNIVQLNSRSYSDEQSFTLFERRLASSQQSVKASDAQPLSPSAEAGGRNSAQAVADSILSFISMRLEQDQKNGASPEQLQSRLEAGLKGFERGFGEASDMLKDLDLMSDKVSADIGETYDLVHQGIEAIAKDLGLESPLDSLVSADAVAEQGGTGSVAPQPVKVDLATPETLKAPISTQVSAPVESPLIERANNPETERVPAFGAQGQSYQLDYSRERSFQMEVTTQDGDTIRIDAASLIEYQESQQYAQGNGSEYASASFPASEDYAAFMSIDGDIDEGEWQAFTELFDQVTELADNFYQGDVAKAFTQALNLGYNSDEISQFSVNLQQTTSVKQAAVYQAIEPQASPWSGSSNPIASLQEYAQELMSASQSMLEKGLSIELIPDLMASTQEQTDQAQQDFLRSVLGIQ